MKNLLFPSVFGAFAVTNKKIIFANMLHSGKMQIYQINNKINYKK